MLKLSIVLPLAAVLLTSSHAIAARATTSSLNAQRVSEITRLLPAAPRGPGEPISNREYWNKWKADPTSQGIVKSAESVVNVPLPDQPDELFLEFSRNGNRDNFQRVALQRRNRLTPLVLAECITNSGRYLPAIEDLITTLCAERTWLLPAHDKKLQNFQGTAINIDLVSSALGWNLAIADYLLGSRLKLETRTRLRAELQRRIIEPYRQMIHGKRKRDSWLTVTSNWNAVCHAGVVGTALIQVSEPRDRAEFVAAAEHFSSYFLSGFTPDGYCSEGLGYWNYGFGNFVHLAENIYQATGGKVDLLSLPGASEPARFGSRIQIINDVAPAFADCSISARPDTLLSWYLNLRFSLGQQGIPPFNRQWTLGSLTDAMLYSRFPAGTGAAPQSGARNASSLRTWFRDAGIYIGRPADGVGLPMGVAFKGGNNAEHHNHNDIGSYVVVVGSQPVLLDPGPETYTKRTFSPQRYDSKLLNSFGHPVPVIDGQLQQKGAKARGNVLASSFTDSVDSVTFDIASAYEVAGLTSLTRSFQYVRTPTCSLTVADKMQSTRPVSFQAALITLGTYIQTANDTLVITDGKSRVQVKIDTAGAPFTVKSEKIEEQAHAKPTRISLDLSQPTTAATITLRISPVGM